MMCHQQSASKYIHMNKFGDFTIKKCLHMNSLYFNYKFIPLDYTEKPIGISCAMFT